MRLYFGGAEVPGWRKLLTAAQVPVSLSFVGLSRRVKNLDAWRIEEKFPAGQPVFLDSGAYSLNKPGSDYTEDDAQELAIRYMEFVLVNLDRLDMVSEFDARILGGDWLEGTREDFWNDLGDKFLPVWHAEDGPEELERLTRLYRRVGVLQADTDADFTPLLNAVTGSSGVLLHGVAMTRMEAMQQVRWDSVGSTSWLSPAQYGDTFVWTGKELKRYPKRYKEQARKRHRTLFEDNGFDKDKILEDDTTEVLRLSIWSWSQFVAQINGHAPKLVTQSPDSHRTANLEWPPAGVDQPGAETRNEELITVPRERRLLPVLSLAQEPADDKTPDGDTEDRVELSGSNLMQCSTCYLKDKCPAFRPGEECVFDIPMIVKTTAQVRALRKAILAMQGQRVMIMRMIEQLEGGYADPNLSVEISRLWKMIKDDADADQDKFSLRIEAHSDGNSGMISRIFGTDTAERALALPSPQPANDVLARFALPDGDIVDAELIDRADK